MICLVVVGACLEGGLQLSRVVKVPIVVRVLLEVRVLLVVRVLAGCRVRLLAGYRFCLLLVRLLHLIGGCHL